MIETKSFTWGEITMGRDIPAELINNIDQVIEVLQRIRDYVGVPITIVSSYRSPAYNKKVGGARFSMHLQFKAIDFKVYGYNDAEYKRLADTIMSGEFGEIGGVGVYSSFIHVDCGKKRYWVG
jgi:uncharacterized protein YcbK (DUF882 family)